MQKLLRSAVALAMILAFAPMTPVSAQGFQKNKNGVVNNGPVINKPIVNNNSGNRKNNKNLAIGIGAAIVGAAIIGGLASGQANARPSHSSRSNYEGSRSYYDRDDGLSCRQLERRCDDGQDWACRKLSRSSRC